MSEQALVSLVIFGSFGFYLLAFCAAYYPYKVFFVKYLIKPFVKEPTAELAKALKDNGEFFTWGDCSNELHYRDTVLEVSQLGLFSPELVIKYKTQDVSEYFTDTELSYIQAVCMPRIKKERKAFAKKKEAAKEVKAANIRNIISKMLKYEEEL